MVGMTDTPPQGLPRKTQPETKSERIAFRVTPNERSELEASAKSRGRSVGDYIRFNLIRSSRNGPPERKKKVSDTDRALAELNRVGLTLVQISRHLNLAGGVPDDLSNAIADVRAAVAKLAGSD